MNLRPLLLPLLLGLASCSPAPKGGLTFHDTVYKGGPQKIPGKVQCAYYDMGGEGVAYHDNDARNNGSGGLNPPNGVYVNEFRMKEGVDISYVKFHDGIDDNPFNMVQPPDGQLYVGWTDPGEWFNLTVDVAEAGTYTVDLLYTSNLSGSFSFDLNGKPLTAPLKLISTKTDKEPVAWRQWHHWNMMSDMAEVYLPKGVNVLTVRIVTEGNMNLAWFDFRKKN
jgi:hypothetical protein